MHLRVYPLKACATSRPRRSCFEKFANKSEIREDPRRRAITIRTYNFAFIDHIVGGTIPNQFIPAVEKGCKELLERGALAGYRMQDVAVEVYFGKDHDVDSSEAAFKTAGRMAFKKAFLAAHPVLLEPIVNLEVTVPVEVHRRHPGRPEHQAGPHRKPGQPARRPGRHQGARRRWPR